MDVHRSIRVSGRMAWRVNRHLMGRTSHTGRIAWKANRSSMDRTGNTAWKVIRRLTDRADPMTWIEFTRRAGVDADTMGADMAAVIIEMNRNDTSRTEMK